MLTVCVPEATTAQSSSFGGIWMMTEALFATLSPFAVVTSDPPRKQSFPTGVTWTERVSLIAAETIFTLVEVTVVVTEIIFVFLVFESIGREYSR